MHLFTRQNSNTEVYLQNCIVRFGWDVINPLARMRQRVTVLVSVCVCVCLSVTTLEGGITHFYARNNVRTASLRYSLDFNVWNFIKMLHSEVMASFAYRDSLRRYCSNP